jgi:3-phosphoshikimate 1-carboxyvinyltransferase
VNPTKLLVHPQKTPLRGSISVPGDKSISHRAVMLAAIADGRSHIRDWLPAGDTLATLEAIRALGIEIEIERHSAFAWNLSVEGKGLHGMRPAAAPLDCRNAGTCMRLLAGILAGQRFASTLDGSSQLRKRPMRRITGPLTAMGADIQAIDDRAPLHIRPAPLRGLDHNLQVASAQVKSAILLAGLYATGRTRVRQPGPARDHTERMLAAMDADIWVNGNDVELSPMSAMSPLALTVPGDISSAAFPLIAAAIVPHSNITVRNIGCNETRTGILDTMAAMGATFKLSNERTTGGEPAADLSFAFDELHSADVGGRTVVRANDEIPVWSVAATQAAGDSTVRDAAELRVKEVDRITLVADELRKLGAVITEHPDGFTVSGPTRLRGGEVNSHGDHRLGMALAVAGLAADGPTLIHHADAIADSFPGFVETMRALGAKIEWAA